MSKEEYKRVMVIQMAVQGFYSNKEASKLLNLSVRQVIRLKNKFKKGGIISLVHGNKGRKPKHSLSDELKEKVTKIVMEKYLNCNFEHIRDLLEEREGIKLSVSSVKRILKSHGFSSPVRKRRRNLRKIRERKPSKGMLVQIDASPCDWIDGENITLLSAIDDATGEILSALFRKKEDLEGYFHLMRGIILNHGIPLSIYHDKHTIFRSPKENKLSIEEEILGIEKALTQFGRAMKELGIIQIYADSPQAKGRIERLFETLQGRLKEELRIEGIKSIESANSR